MQVNVQKLSPVLVEFDVVIDADLVKKEVDKAYRSVAKTARVRGFRPGKAPRKILTHMFGARVAADVAQRLVDDSFPKAVSEQKVQPISSPAFEPQKLVDNQPFTYKARFEIIPEIENVDYDGLEAKRPKTTVDPEDLEAELSALRRENSTLEAPESERAAQTGDVVTIDFDVEVNGQVVEGAGAQDFQVELGAGSLIPAIEEALIGTNVGAQAQTVPSILIVLRDARDRIVYSWEVRPPKRTLAPGETVTVNEAVTDVPRSARFAEIGWKPS